MFRLLILSSGLALWGMAATAETAAEKAERCAEQGAIANRIAEARQDGAGADEAMAAMTADDSGVAARFVPTVAPLVEWIYGLPEDQLGLDIGAALKAQCLEFDQ